MKREEKRRWLKYNKKLVVWCLKTCIIDANFEAQKVYDTENSNVESKHLTP